MSTEKYECDFTSKSYVSMYGITDSNKKIRIYYTGIGSDGKYLFNENEFRLLINSNQHIFNEKCTLNAFSDSLDVLLDWVGANRI
jgi:hypothetical protein